MSGSGLQFARLGLGASRSQAYQPDEHVQTGVSEHGDRHSPRPAGAQTAEKQHAGLLKLDAQPSAARIRPPEGRGAEGLCLGAASLYSGHLRGIGPEPGTWKDPDPRRRSSRGSGGSE